MLVARDHIRTAHTGHTGYMRQQQIAKAIGQACCFEHAEAALPACAEEVDCIRNQNCQHKNSLTASRQLTFNLVQIKQT